MTDETTENAYPAEKEFEQGQAALAKGDLEKAFDFWTQAAQLKNPKAHFALAALYEENKLKSLPSAIEERLSSAKTHLQKAIAIGYIPKTLIALLNKINDQILREILKKSLQRPFDNRDEKSLNSILTFLKVDDTTRAKFITTYQQENEAEFKQLVREL